MRAGEIAFVRDGEGKEVLSYRSFASVVPIVAALMAGIVIITGLAASLFLLMEGRLVPSIAVVALSAGFSILISMLVPRVRVTLYDRATPVLFIAQRARTPFMPATFAVAAADGTQLATLQKNFLSRIGRNRWTVAAPPDQYGVAWAVEESLSKAMLRKIAGKFKRQFQTNLRISHHGTPIATIIRRPDASGEFDLLEISPNGSLDRRVIVALATLVFGMEP